MLGGFRHSAKPMYWRQCVGRIGAGEAPAHFAFQLVRQAASVFLAAQCALPPFTRVGEQIVVVQFSYVHGWLHCANAMNGQGLRGFVCGSPGKTLRTIPAAQAWRS